MTKPALCFTDGYRHLHPIRSAVTDFQSSFSAIWLSALAQKTKTNAHMDKLTFIEMHLVRHVLVAFS